MKSSPFQSQFARPEDSPGFLLWRVSNVWQRLQRNTLKKIGLTHAQFVLLAGLAWLSKENQPVTQNTLARFIQMDRMMASQVARSLEKGAMLRRSAHPTDSRALRVEITPRGLNLVSKALPLVENIDRQFFHLNEPDLDNLLKALQELGRLQE